MIPYVEAVLLKFVDTIPPSKNPYLETAKYIEKLTMPPPVNPLVKWLKRCILLSSFIMLCQASHLLYRRLKAGKSQFFGLNTLGLIKIDFINFSCAAAFVYSSVTVSDLIFREFVEAGYHDQSSQLIIFGGKFVILVIESWVLWWGCLCHCLLTLRRISGKDSNFARPSMASPLTWIINSGFLIMIMWPIVPTLWAWYSTNEEYLKIKRILKPVLQSLRQLAPSHAARTYKEYQILKLIIPVVNAIPHVDSLLSHVRNGFLTYIIADGLLFLAAFAVLILELMCFRDQRASLNLFREKEPVNVPCKHALRPSKAFDSGRYQQGKILWVAFLFQASHLGFLFVVTWSYIFTNSKSLFQSNWWAFVELGSHAPGALFGNYCLFLGNRINNHWDQKTSITSV